LITIVSGLSPYLFCSSSQILCPDIFVTGVGLGVGVGDGVGVGVGVGEGVGVGVAVGSGGGVGLGRPGSSISFTIV
jgi:hypothetical protein